MSTKPQPKKLYPMFTARDGIVVARDANPAKPQDLRHICLQPNNKDSIKVEGIVVSVSSSSCTLDSTEPKARKKSGDDSPGGGRSWHSGVVDTIGGPIIPTPTKGMTFMDSDDSPEGINWVNKIGGSLEAQKVLVGGENNTVVVPTLAPTHSNIISSPTTVGSSTARSVTVVKDKKKLSSGGSRCKCGCGKRAPTGGYTLKCAQLLGVPNDPLGKTKNKTEKKKIKKALMAEKRLAAAGLSVNEDVYGDDLIQAIVIMIKNKELTAYPEVHKLLLHHMPTMLDTKTPTLGEAIELSGAALYVGYTGQGDVDEENTRFLISSKDNKNPVLLKMNGSSITRSEAKETFGFASSVVYTCKSKLNARNVEAALQTHWKDLKFGYRRLWRDNDRGAKYDTAKDVGKAHSVFLTISPLVQGLVDGGKLQINN
jgi:hypothetical protein